MNAEPTDARRVLGCFLANDRQLLGPGDPGRSSYCFRSTRERAVNNCGVFWPSLEISPVYSRFAGLGETHHVTVIDRPFLEYGLAQFSFGFGGRREEVSHSGFGLEEAGDGVEFAEVECENLHGQGSLVLLGGAKVTGSRRC